MATIEPRLIHLLNESTATPRPPHAELPPIKGLDLPKPTGLLHLHAIERDAGQRTDGASEPPAVQAQSSSQPSLPSLSFLPVTDEGSANGIAARRDDGFALERSVMHQVSSQDLRMILDDPADPEDTSLKKRPVKEDFVQLPQPHKKQKASSQPHVFPPIIVGLVEPPLNAARFPPIASSSFDEHPRSEPPLALGLAIPAELKAGQSEDKAALDLPTPELERTPTGKVKRRAAKPRRKWSEEETNHLLLGVHKHGVGRWTDILEDPEYNFNERTAGDLKDRFRTCCPEELRDKNGQQHPQTPIATTSGSRPKKGLMAENILNEPDAAADGELSPTAQNDSDSAPKQRKSRAHRKNLEDLAELGIKGPFKKSQRRGRRPFSEQDDREILQGFEIYGPQWTKIQRDPQFNLSSRQPTDLRDRLRNKYPEKFAGTEKPIVPVKEPARTNNLLEPSIDMNIGNSLDKSKAATLEPQMNRTASREDIPRWLVSSGAVDAADTQQPAAGVFWSEATGTAFSSGVIGEMDISRLLLDDTHGGEQLSADRRGLA